MARVSVIVATYNYGRFIGACLESILAQTYREFEVIVVDDGSTDGTRDVLKKYEKGIYSIYQENRGPAAARNKGIDASSGEYLAFLDSDDCWLPEKLEEQVKVLDGDPDIGIVFSDASAFDGEKIVRDSILKEEKICTGYCFERLFMGNYLVMPTVIIRRACLEKTGPFDEELRGPEEYDLWLRIAAFYKIGFVNKVLALYRIHSSSVSADTCRLLENELLVIQKMIRLFPERVRCMGRNVHIRLCSLFNRYGLELVKEGRMDLAKTYFRKAVVEWPFDARSYSYFLASLAGKRGFESLRRFKRSWSKSTR